jgi:serine/threonine protein kinase
MAWLKSWLPARGASAAASTTFESHYAAHEVLGSGSFATVYRCVEKEDIIRLLGTTVQVVDDSEGGGGEGGRNPATTRWTMSTLRGMKPSALKQMAKCLNVSMVGCLEKKDMVDAIVASGKVDVDMGAGEEKEEKEGKDEERSGGRRK